MAFQLVMGCRGGPPNSSLDGWFISWKIRLKWMMTGGTPMTQETPPVLWPNPIFCRFYQGVYVMSYLSDKTKRDILTTKYLFQVIFQIHNFLIGH